MNIEVHDKVFSSMKVLIEVNNELRFVSKKSFRGDRFEVCQYLCSIPKCIGTWNTTRNKDDQGMGCVLCSLSFFSSEVVSQPILIKKLGSKIQFISNDRVVDEGLMGRRKGVFRGFGINEIDYTFRNSLIAQVDDFIDDNELVKVVSILIYLHYSNSLT